MDKQTMIFVKNVKKDIFYEVGGSQLIIKLKSKIKGFFYIVIVFFIDAVVVSDLCSSSFKIKLDYKKNYNSKKR